MPALTFTVFFLGQTSTFNLNLNVNFTFNGNLKNNAHRQLQSPSINSSLTSKLTSWTLTPSLIPPVVGEQRRRKNLARQQGANVRNDTRSDGGREEGGGKERQGRGGGPSNKRIHKEHLQLTNGRRPQNREIKHVISKQT